LRIASGSTVKLAGGWLGGYSLNVSKIWAELTQLRIKAGTGKETGRYCALE